MRVLLSIEHNNLVTFVQFLLDIGLNFDDEYVNEQNLFVLRAKGITRVRVRL